MAVQWDWGDYWACYMANPEKLQDDVEQIPEWLATKSSRVQIEVIRFAPKEILPKLMPALSFEAQIALLK